MVMVIAAVLVAAAAAWTLRAYRRAGGADARTALVACAAIGAIAAGAYLAVGRPELGGAPYQHRIAALQQRPLTSLSPDEALAVMTERARQQPDSSLPHLVSGEILLRTGRPREAALAFETALRREPRQAAAMLGLGEALVSIDGRFTPEAVALFEQAATLTDDPAPWVYQAMAASEQGRAGDARRLWGEAYARMAEDDPFREQARRLSGAGR
ncbi:MAG: tetratricopeptide repeat protein [Hyphomonadaceae bacterium]